MPGWQSEWMEDQYENAICIYGICRNVAPIFSTKCIRCCKETQTWVECTHLCLWRSEGAAERLLQRVQEGLDLVQALVASLWRPESHDMEVFENLLKACLAHLQSDAPVAEETWAPDAEHRLTAVDAGGSDKAQEGLDLLGCDGTPALVRAEALLELLGIHVGLDNHILDAIVWDEELEEVQCCGSGWHLLSRAWMREERKREEKICQKLWQRETDRMTDTESHMGQLTVTTMSLHPCFFQFDRILLEKYHFFNTVTHEKICFCWAVTVSAVWMHTNCFLFT